MNFKQNGGLMAYRWAVIKFLSLVLMAQPFYGCAKVKESGILPFMGTPSPDFSAELLEANSSSDKMHMNGPSARSGEWLSININNNTLLSNVVRVTASGDIGLPQIGKIHVEGLSGQAVERAIIVKAQKADILITKVSVGFFQSGPVYVLGEVRQAGEFAYREEAVLVDLIDQAGGLTYRADARRVFITRYNQPEEIEMPVARTSKIMPGDVIRVPQRYF